MIGVNLGVQETTGDQAALIADELRFNIPLT
jgi:hypothetical protein